MNLHSVLLQIATQSLPIGECNYFGSHNSDIRNDPGRVRSPHANIWAGLSVHVSASICTFVYIVQAAIFLELHPHDCNL